MKCAKCGSTTGHCAECGTKYAHGTFTYCTKESCKEVGAPIDCDGCLYTVLVDDDGVSGTIEFDGELLPFTKCP
jgi:hypothetical protein